MVTASVALIVAAQVSPQQYAMWGIAVIVIQFQFVLRLGLGPALIFHRSRTHAEFQRNADDAFSLTTGLATATAVVLFALAPWLASLFSKGFSQHELTLAIRIMCVPLILMTMEDVPVSLLEKTMNFRLRSYVEITTALVYAVTALGLVAAGLGVWSLIVAKLVQSVGRTVAFWRFAPARPRIRARIDWTALRVLLKYGSLLTMAGVVGFATSNLDTVAVGLAFGATALGVYALAFTLCNFVPTFLGESLVRVFFPVFAAKRDSDGALHETFLASLHVLAGIMLPTSVVLLAFGPRLLVEVFGPQWAVGGRILQVLALYALARSLGDVATSMRSATGRAGLSLRARIWGLVASLLVLWPCLALGTIGVAIAFTVGQSAIATVALLSLPAGWRKGAWRPFIAPSLAAIIGLVAGSVLVPVSGVSQSGIFATIAFLLAYAPVLLVADSPLRRMLAALLLNARQSSS